MKPLAQFHVFNFSTSKVEIYFRDQVPGLKLPEATYGRPSRDGKPATWKAHIFAPSKDEHDAFAALLQANGIDFRSSETITPPARWFQENLDQMTLPVEIEAEVDTPHKLVSRQNSHEFCRVL